MIDDDEQPVYFVLHTRLGADDEVIFYVYGYPECTLRRGERDFAAWAAYVRSHADRLNRAVLNMQGTWRTTGTTWAR